MSASEPGEVSRKSDFLSLPPEIRNEIYSLLVVSPKPIRICSPRSKHQIKKTINPSNFCQLLCVNKQINAESAMMFYAVNTFTIGNGPFGSKSITNLHAFQAFIKRVPANHLGGIRRVDIELFTRRWTRSLNAFCFGTLTDAKDLHSIARTLTKHFKSLEVVNFSYEVDGPFWYGHQNWPRLTGAPLTRELTKILRTLLKNGTLVSIGAYSVGDVDMKAAVDEILKSTPAAEPILKILPLDP